MDGKIRRIQQVFGVIAVIGLLFAIGCASSKMTAKSSGERIFEADKVYLAAKDGDASVNAKEALAVAEGKLAKAKEAFGKEDYEEAARLSDQAVVDVEYALAKAKTQKSLNAAEEIKKNNEALRQEIQRMSK